MYTIIKKEKLVENIYLMGIKAEHIVKNAKSGNFLIIIPDEKGERIPLTIYDWDKERGVVYIIFQTVGTSTFKLAKKQEGDSVFAIAGPLGKHFDIQKYGKVVLVGGGVGVPAIFPISRDLKKEGNEVISITGFRTKDLIILENEMKKVSSKVLIATNDGSYGEKGLVTDVLKNVISKEKIDLVIAIGPVVMMKAVSDLTKNYNIKTIVSLNALMVDGTGMCGACRVTVGNEIRFACVDGPDFDGHLVDFDELNNRLSSYKEEEKRSFEHCKLNKLI